ncbi:MAG: peptide deformylase [Acidobacteria bacterium]|nr:MAG: peptide deformylase [Acidobacteriota bacterium]MCL4286197.1 peptide deformylase [Thermoleophilia bacterium]GIK78301.1 MAG: peptide deformylase 1 [Actinomycetes bacterium]
MAETEAREAEAGAEPGVDDETLERRRRALGEVRQFGDPVLKSKASPVTDFGPELRAAAERMHTLMENALGIGLAATQLGLMRRLLVFQSTLDAEPRAIVNPRVEWASGELATAEEGCLSLADILVDVERPLHARVSAVDLGGTPLTIEASGLEARVLQHEIDHLDGILILDRTERRQRRAALRALREGERFEPAMLEGDGEPEPGSE